MSWNSSWDFFRTDVALKIVIPISKVTFRFLLTSSIRECEQSFMSNWKKVMDRGTVASVLRARGTGTEDFGRFCIQPLEKASAAHLVASLRKALSDALPGAAVAGFRFRLVRDHGEDQAREKLSVLGHVKDWLRELRITSPGRYPLAGSREENAARAVFRPRTSASVLVFR